MRPLSHPLVAMLPALVAVPLVFLTAVPLEGGVVSYTPNIALLMTLVLTGSARFSWPRGLAFALGLLQDVLFGTPLAAQALLALLLAQWQLWQQSRRPSPVQFRLRWIEAAATLIACHGLLWVLLYASHHNPAPLSHLLVMGAVNGLWYPMFYRLWGHKNIT